MFGTPNVAAVSASLLADGARQVFYHGNEAVAAHLDSIGGAEGENPRVYRALWGQAFGTVQNRDATLDTTVFDQARSYDLDSRQDFFGAQIGVDLLGGGRSALGLSGGYSNSRLKLLNAPSRLGYEAWNLSAYGRANLGALFVNGLAKYEKYSVDFTVPAAGVRADANGDGWGGWVEVGARLGGGSFFVEPAASIEYTQIDLDGFTAAGTDFGFDEAEGLRGKAGVRIGAVIDTSPSLVTVYGRAQVIHEFKGGDRLTLANAGGSLAFDTPQTDTYGRATAGFSAWLGSGVRGFIEGTADFAGGVSGGGGRAGLAISF